MKHPANKHCIDIVQLVNLYLNTLNCFTLSKKYCLTIFVGYPNFYDSLQNANNFKIVLQNVKLHIIHNVAFD